MTTAWEMHDDPEITLNPRPAGALTNLGYRLLRCADVCLGVDNQQSLTMHSAHLGSVYWRCPRCGGVREDRACTPEDFPYQAPPAQLQTANLAVNECPTCQSPDPAAKPIVDTGARLEFRCDDPWHAPAVVDVRPGAQCVQCRSDEAVMTAYFDDLGKTANLLPWCAACCATLAPLTVAIGLPVTLMPLEPIPGLAELRAALDRAQLGDRDDQVDEHEQARAAVRRTAPAGRKPGEWR